MTPYSHRDIDLVRVSVDASTGQGVVKKQNNSFLVVFFIFPLDIGTFVWQAWHNRGRRLFVEIIKVGSLGLTPQGQVHLQIKIQHTPSETHLRKRG